LRKLWYEDRALRAGQQGRRHVNEIYRTARDDENDTRLFDTLQEYVIEHYPNPQRVGCLDPDLLRRFVETPEQLDLRDPKYLHMFKCAECTRALRQLRCIREAQAQVEREGSLSLIGSHTKAKFPWGKRIASGASKTRLTLLRFVARLMSVFR